MPKIDVQDAQINLADLIERALAGEEIIIVRDDHSLVRLVPIDTELRPVGLHATTLRDLEADEAMRPIGNGELWERDLTSKRRISTTE